MVASPHLSAAKKYGFGFFDMDHPRDLILASFAFLH